MQSRISILDQLIETIISKDDYSGIDIILFGSFLSRDTYNDIDILIIFDDVPYTIVKRFREEIAYSLQAVFNVPTHFTTLSLNEYNYDKRLHQIESLEIYKGIK